MKMSNCLDIISNFPLEVYDKQIKIMGTNLKNSDHTSKVKMELVGKRASYSTSMNKLLEKVKMRKLSEKEIGEVKIDSYNYSY